jgi:hypothetical protein
MAQTATRPAEALERLLNAADAARDQAKDAGGIV